MIDLSANIKVYPIKLWDKSILHLKAPTQGLLRKVMDFQNDVELEDLDSIAKIYDLLDEIFNRNYDNKKIKKSDIEDNITMENSAYILSDYLENTIKKLGE